MSQSSQLSRTEALSFATLDQRGSDSYRHLIPVLSNPVSRYAIGRVEIPTTMNDMSKLRHIAQATLTMSRRSAGGKIDIQNSTECLKRRTLQMDQPIQNAK